MSMAAIGGTSDETSQVDIRFRPLARAAAVSFLLTMAVSGLLTFTATAYSPETDKITIFWGVFNPCIWFDHYPAKLFAMYGVCIFLLIIIAFGIVWTLYHYAGKQVGTTMWAAILVGMTTMVQIAFVNVFTTNLYPETNPSRSLHGAHMIGNSTVSLVEQDEMQRLNAADTQVVKLHSTFYVAWVIAELCFSLHLAYASRPTVRRFKIDQIFWAILFPCSWVMMFLHISGMLIIIMEANTGNWQLNFEQLSPLQLFFIHFADVVKANFLGIWPILYYRLAVPSTMGVRLTFRLAASSGDDGIVVPSKIVSCSLSLLALLFIFSAVFHTSYADDQSVRYFRLAGGLRSKPYAYVAAPLWLLAWILAAIGIGFTLVHQHLRWGKMASEVWLVFETWVATALLISMFGGLCLLLEQERFSWVFLLLFEVAYPLWVVIRQSASARGVGVCYVLLVWGSFFAMIFGPWPCDLLHLASLSLYGFVVPNEPFWITVERLNDQEGPAGKVAEEGCGGAPTLLGKQDVEKAADVLGREVLVEDTLVGI